MKTKPKDERRYGRWFVEQSTGEEIHDILAHVKEKHGIDLRTTKVKQEMVMHVDGADFFSGSDKFEVGAATYLICYCHKRTGMSAAMWRDE